jgi:hypothetical protein
MMLFIGQVVPNMRVAVFMADPARSVTIWLKNTGAGSDYPVSGAGNNRKRKAVIGRNNARH